LAAIKIFSLGFHVDSFSKTHRYSPTAAPPVLRLEPELKTQQFCSHHHGGDVSGGLLFSRDSCGNDQFDVLPKADSRKDASDAVSTPGKAKTTIPHRDGILKCLLLTRSDRSPLCMSRSPFHPPADTSIALRGITPHSNRSQAKRRSGPFSKSHLDPLRPNEITNLDNCPTIPIASFPFATLDLCYRLTLCHFVTTAIQKMPAGSPPQKYDRYTEPSSN